MVPVRRTKGLPTASFRFHLTMDTLAVQLCASSLPRCTRDFHPLERAHGAQTKKSSGHFVHLKTEEADRHTSIRFKYRYAVFCSFSGGACSCFASRKAFFRSPCRLICAAYRQSSEQYFTLFRVVVNTLPQCSQVSSRLRSFAASCR